MDGAHSGLTTVKLLRLRASLDFYKNLKDFLEFIKSNGYSSIAANNPNWKAFKQTLKKKGIVGLDEGDIKSTLRQLDIINGTAFSSFGEELYSFRSDEQKLKNLLALKMLKEKKGWAYCHVLSKTSGKTREEIFEAYKAMYDSDIQEEYTDISKYNIFLEWLGIAKRTGSTYIFIKENFESLLDIPLGELERVSASLSNDAKLCLLALIKLDSNSHKKFEGKEIRKTVGDLYGEDLSVHNMQLYSTELKRLGLITYSHRGRTSSYRRGSVGEWELNRDNSLLRDLTASLLETFLIRHDWPLADIIQKSFKQLLKDMKTEDVYKKGVYLEQFASKICWALGLREIQIRDIEHGVELDVTGIKTKPFFTKFLVQCKNHRTPTSVSILLREIGIALSEKYNNIILISTSGFVKGMRPYADRVMNSTGLNIYLIDKEDIEKISEEPRNIYSIFERENKHIKDVRVNFTMSGDGYWSQF